MRTHLIYKGIPKNRPLPEVFSEREINQILKQISVSKDYLETDWGRWMQHRDMALISTIYILGLRPLCACRLRFDDFNWRTATVRIRGENNKAKRDRVLPVPKILLKILKPYLSFPRSRFWRGSNYLFPSYSHPSISSARLKHIFREKVLKPLRLWRIPEVGKVPKIRLYTLRHSRATHLMKKQIKEKGQPDLFAIANFLGHTDIRSTAVYLHTDQSYMEYLRGEIEI